MVKPTGSKKKDWFLLTSPGTTSVCGEFPLQHPVSSSLKNTKEAGAGKKEVLPPKSPTPRLVGSVKNLRCCLTIDGFWMPVWFASDFGSKQGEGGPINFFAPCGSYCISSRMSGPGSNLGQALVAAESQTEI